VWLTVAQKEMIQIINQYTVAVQCKKILLNIFHCIEQVTG